MVDVSNWQTVAANKFVQDPNIISKLRRAWKQTALWALVFPGVIGVYLGLMLRSKSDIPESQLLTEIVSLLPGGDVFVQSVVLAIVLMGFFVLALGYAENLLSAAQFTFMVDVFRRKRYDEIVSKSDRHDTALEEDTFVQGCQRRTFGIAIVSVALFQLALWRLGEGNVFSFMYMIFGSATSMFPALLFATIRTRKGLRCDERRFRLAALASILSGYIVAMSPLLFPGFAELSPFFTILVATVVLVTIAPGLLAEIMGQAVKLLVGTFRR